MSKARWLAAAARTAPGIFQIRRGTWLIAAVGLLVLVGLLIWAAVSLVGWLLGMTQSLAGSAPEAARSVIAQAEQIAPGVRDKLDDLLQAPRADPPPRDVSGSDVIPVARYPGLVRTHWHREDHEVAVKYEGVADSRDVLEHYVTGLAAHGYAHEVISATPDSERHAFRKGGDHVIFTLARMPQDRVEVTIATAQPAPPATR